MVMVMVTFSSTKVVLNSTYPCTSTWFPAKLTKHPSYGLNWSRDNYKLSKVSQNITSAELPWSIKTLCTFRSIVTTDITTESCSWETTSSRSTPVKHKAGSWARSCLLVSKDITTRAHHLRLVFELPPPENPPEIVFNSPWISVSCTRSLRTTSPCDPSRLSMRYSFKNPSLTRSTNWWPKAMHRSMLCLNALWNSHQAFFRDPRFYSIF